MMVGDGGDGDVMVVAVRMMAVMVVALVMM
jgi:hypothetical protein